MSETITITISRKTAKEAVEAISAMLEVGIVQPGTDEYEEGERFIKVISEELAK